MLTAVDSIVCNVLVAYVVSVLFGEGFLGQPAVFSLMFEWGCEAFTAPIFFVDYSPANSRNLENSSRKSYPIVSRRNSIS
jgi:hypothetical protein